jgi:O-methyltransferase
MTPKTLNIAEYFKAEANRVRPYSGQMTPKFQDALVQYHKSVTLKDCSFYHTIDFPDGTSVQAEWDLRGHDDDYLGGVALRGQKVIEYGPASGYLSNAIAKAGADLTVFDLPMGTGPDVMPFPGADLEEVSQNGAASATRLRNSWWYSRNKFGFNARAVYADIYRQPSDIGEYDVAFFGAILVHLSNPFMAIKEASQITRKTMIITDLVALGPHDGLPGMMQIGTSQPPIGHVHWWNYSVSAFRIMLERAGFGYQSVFLHSPGKMSEQPPMVTVVAHRS